MRGNGSFGPRQGIYKSNEGQAWYQDPTVPTDANVLFAPNKINDNYYLPTDQGLYVNVGHC